MTSIFPSTVIQGMSPSKITSLDDLSVYAEGKEVTASGAALKCPSKNFVFVPLAGPNDDDPASAATPVKRPVLPNISLKGAVVTGRGFSGMVSSAGGAVVKSTLVQEENTGGPRVQIDHVVVTGTGPDDACDSFEANPFKVESACSPPSFCPPFALFSY
jgi:hypothetical protein